MAIKKWKHVHENAEVARVLEAFGVVDANVATGVKELVLLGKDGKEIRLIPSYNDMQLFIPEPTKAFRIKATVDGEEVFYNGGATREEADKRLALLNPELNPEIEEGDTQKFVAHDELPF